MHPKIAIRRVCLLLLLFTLCAVTALAQTTSFTYQGRLQDGGTPANGNYDLQFALFDDLSGGAQVGATQTVSTVSVSGGVFTVQLDFGGSAFPGANRFLEISVRPTGGSGFTTLTPRHQISSTPYAIRSANATTAATATNATTAANLSGTPALPNGTTATTQSQADASMKLATTAYVDTGLATKQNSLAYTAENQANKSTNTSLGTSDTLYPTQKAVKTYVDSLAFGGGSGSGGADGDLQMKSAGGFAASAINDDGSAISFNRPVKFLASDNAFSRWTFNNNNSFSLASTLAAPTVPSASLLNDATGACTAGAHQFKVTYVTPSGETDASPASNAVTCTASQKKVTITLPTGNTSLGFNTVATGRNIYATKAGGSTYFRIAPSPVVNNNTATSYTFSIADSSFQSPQAPAANTAVDNRIFVDQLGNVGIGTTQPQFTDDSQGKSVAIDGGSAEAYLGLGSNTTNVNARIGGLNFYNSGLTTSDRRIAAIFAFNDGGLAKGNLHFLTAANEVGPLLAGSINSEQNWGIGRYAASGVRLIIKAGSSSPTQRVLSVGNFAGSAAFLNFWNDGTFQLSNGRFQVDGGPFQVSSTGEVDAQSLQLTSAAKPACNSSNRGKFWYVAGGAGVKDTVEVCAKDAANAYAWRVIF